MHVFLYNHNWNWYVDVFIGRYFATSLYAVAVNVLNKKQLTSASERKSFMYYVNDGIYGTFNFMAFNDYYTVTPLLLKVNTTACMDNNNYIRSVFVYQTNSRGEYHSCKKL